jgi:anti-sigma B factor antagonist
MFSTDLSTRSCDGYAVVALRGELDLADAAVVAAALTAVAAREPGIIVDLAGLEFIDSSGVAALARGRRQARRAGGDLVLAAPQQKVMRVLAIIRLAEAFAVYATVEEAAVEAGHFRERAIPVPQQHRRARWPRAVRWSRTHGLPSLHTCRTPPGPGQAASRLLPAAAADPEAGAIPNGSCRTRGYKRPRAASCRVLSSQRTAGSSLRLGCQ